MHFAPDHNFKIPLYKRNWARGRIVEFDTATTSLGHPKNTQTFAVDLGDGIVNSIPDLVSPLHVVEVKDVLRLSRTRQVRAQVKLAQDTGRRYVLICTTRTQRISRPLQLLMNGPLRYLIRRNVNTNTYQIFDYIDPPPSAGPLGDWVDIPVTNVQAILNGQ